MKATELRERLLQYSRYVGVYLAIVLAVAILMPSWHAPDNHVLGLQLARSAPPFDPSITPIDLSATDANRREKEFALLRAINAAAKRMNGPSKVLFDVSFEKNYASPKAPSKAFAAMLNALKAQGIPTFGSVYVWAASSAKADLDFMSSLDDTIYGAISGIGHTDMAIPSGAPPDSFFWYPGVEHFAGSTMTLGALALVAQANGNALPPEVDRQIVVPLGSHATFQSQLKTIDQAIKDPDSLARQIVMIGDVKGEHVFEDFAPERSHFELAAWSVSDQLAAARGLPQPFADTGLMLGLALFCPALAIGAFMLVFARLRKRRGVLTVSVAAALVAGFASLALVDTVLLARGLLFPQLTLPAVCIVAAAGVCTWAGADAIRRARFVTELNDRVRTVAEAYDVFISYSHEAENAKWVEEQVLKPLLAARMPDGRPLRVFFDRESLKVGFRWYTRIVESIYGSRFFIPIYSKGYFDRPFCTDELDIAMLRQVENAAFMLPIARVTDIPKRYERVQYVDVERDPDFIATIIGIITGTLAEEKKPAQPVALT